MMSISPLPLVSVVTATYNAMAHLDECVESVKQQQTDGLFEIEHIFVDGGSTDGTVAYIQSLIDAGYRARYISESDKGIYDAMNKGVRMAEGCIVNFLNADDRFADEHAVRLSVLPILKGEADFTFGTSKLFEADGTCQRIFPPTLGLTYLNHPFSHQTLFVKKEAFNACGEHDLRFAIAADTHLMWTLKLLGYRGMDIEAHTISGYVGGASYTHYWIHETALSTLEHVESIASLMCRDAGYAARVATFTYIHGRCFPAWAPEKHRSQAARHKIDLIAQVAKHCSLADRLFLRYLKRVVLSPAAKGMPIERKSWRFITSSALMHLMFIMYRIRFGQKFVFS